MASRSSDMMFTRALPSGPAARSGTPPASPVATLRFALPDSARGSVVVVDAGGMVVRTLLSPVVPAGEVLVAWNGLDELGERAPRGPYCMRLEVEGRLLTSRRVEIR